MAGFRWRMSSFVRGRSPNLQETAAETVANVWETSGPRGDGIEKKCDLALAPMGVANKFGLRAKHALATSSSRSDEF